MPSERPPFPPVLTAIADDPSDAGATLPSSPSPAVVLEHAASCVRFVLAALKLELDFTRETLPLLDHYLEQAREAVRVRPETLSLVASAAGAYLGEVVRRLHPCWWRAESRDPLEWRLEFRDVFLCFHPVQIIHAALSRPPVALCGTDADDPDGAIAIDDESSHEDDEELTPIQGAEEEPEPLAPEEAASFTSVGSEPEQAEPGLFIEDEDRDMVRARLERLPRVTDEEYWAPSTRLEVVDIVVDAIGANLLAQPLRRRTRGPADYD